MPRTYRLITIAAAVVASLTAASAPPPVSAAPGDTSSDVTAAVCESVLARAATTAHLPRENADPKVTVSRRADGWAFGNAVVPAPRGGEAHPVGWLFVARQEGTRWRVALDGEPAFADLTKRAPFTTAAERRLFPSHDGRSAEKDDDDMNTGMRLPFALGQTWMLRGGPHGWNGRDTPYSSVDLAGGDQVVRAARGGTAYTMCKGWIRIIHDRGYATDYYHLWDNIKVDGAAVEEGAFLGNTGTDTTCGGGAGARHVHFALRRDGEYASIVGHGIGKWVFFNSEKAYRGGARHGSHLVNRRGPVYNYGRLGFDQGVIDADNGAEVKRYTGPGTKYHVAGTVTDGATVTIACSRTGTRVTGRQGKSDLWNRLSDGTYVSDALMWTGVTGPRSGYC